MALPRDRCDVARWWRVIAPALLLCMHPFAIKAQEGATELRSIRFEGQSAFDKGLLRAAIESTPSSCKSVLLTLNCWLGVGGRESAPVDRNALLSDVFRLRLFYADRGYREAQVTLDTIVRNGVMHATFRVREGEPVRVTRVELGGTEQVDSITALRLRRALARLPVQLGQPLSILANNAERDSLANRLQNAGYPGAEVFARYLIPRDSARVAHVGFDLAPGGQYYFGEPQISGNQKVSSRVIRRMLDLRKGALYSGDAILRSQRNLFALDMFRNIDIRTDLDAAGDTITPTVNVVEGDLARVRTGLGLSTSESFSAEGRWIRQNFMGGARRVEFRARVANILAGDLASLPLFDEGAEGIYDDPTWLLSLDLTQPWFFDLNNSLGAGLFVERRSIVDVFVRTSIGGYFAVTRALGPGTSISVGYRPELTGLIARDDIFCTNFVLCEANEIELLKESRWLAPLTLSLVRDRSNSLFSPTRGYIVRLEGEYAASASGSEFGYARIGGEWTTYREPLRGLVLATRVRPGWARPINEPGAGFGLHPQKRFFAGGPNSVRGFGQYRLGPKLLRIDADTLLSADTVIGFPGCRPQDVNAGTCDVSILADSSPNLFDPRPVGGAVVLEGNVEARFPLIGKLGGAAFVDVGQVWTAGKRVRLSDLIWTPGIGLRLTSAIGPIRIDVGYNTQGAEQLQVLTTKFCVKAEGESEACAPDSIQDGVNYPREDLESSGVLTPLGTVSYGAGRSIWNRLQLHFSIGQAF